MGIVCRKADLIIDGNTVLELLNAYCVDPYGGGEALGEYSQKNLIPELLKRQETAHVFLAFVDGDAAGIAITIVGYEKKI